MILHTFHESTKENRGRSGDVDNRRDISPGRRESGRMEKKSPDSIYAREIACGSDVCFDTQPAHAGFYPLAHTPRTRTRH